MFHFSFRCFVHRRMKQLSLILLSPIVALVIVLIEFFSVKLLIWQSLWDNKSSLLRKQNEDMSKKICHIILKVNRPNSKGIIFVWNTHKPTNIDQLNRCLDNCISPSIEIMIKRISSYFNHVQSKKFLWLKIFLFRPFKIINKKFERNKTSC